MSSRAILGQLCVGLYRADRPGLARVGVWAADLKAFELIAGDAYSIVLCTYRPANSILRTLPLYADPDTGGPKEFPNQ